MRWIILPLAAAMVWQALAGDGRGQLVQVGPGYVRAPFVCVDWGCEGTRVRAPFVDIRTPGYRGRRVSMPGESAEVALRRELARASDDLYASLGRFDTAGMWREYLMVAPGMALAPNAVWRRASVESLERALANFHAVGGDSQFEMIAKLPAFVATQDLLEAYLRERQGMETQPEELPGPTENVPAERGG